MNVLLIEDCRQPDSLTRALGTVGLKVECCPDALIADLPDPVVLTAWTTKQTCSGVDLDEVATFIGEQQGRGPGTDF